jgi:hypothetical protein
VNEQKGCGLHVATSEPVHSTFYLQGMFSNNPRTEDTLVKNHSLCSDVFCSTRITSKCSEQRVC